MLLPQILLLQSISCVRDPPASLSPCPAPSFLPAPRAAVPRSSLEIVAGFGVLGDLSL